MTDRRSKICTCVIIAGLANFAVYIALYAYFYGEAVNGKVVLDQDGAHYFLQSGQEVSRGVFLYSGIHSISIWPTVAAIMLAMLTLAKDRITSAVRSTVVHGRATFTVLAIVIALITGFMTFVFIQQFARRFELPQVHSRNNVVDAPSSFGPGLIAPTTTVPAERQP